MSITALFIELGAPLANHRWSWGSVRVSDGVVFLRAWKDETSTRDGRERVRLTDNKRFRSDPKPGYKERLKHIEMIKNGLKCYVVMCDAEDTTAVPRKIKKYSDKVVFVGGRLLNDAEDIHDDWWLELGEDVPLSLVRFRPAA